ncbi:glycosyltransferase [Flavobacterium frigoris]|uniref:Glycosyl transferase, group 1 n=1 Tax=Flavobacterium frigoris (strain PS1) TaxID=1086011 RepID=H7FWH1_FLAFP|nr:glycosyltransferase [Flavobacterium frigoris]EIA07143.1 glycosyl transferase, group 1 [Flavobacterium frigoris PS1]
MDANLKMILISSFPPRECGIATFSQDLSNALNTIYGCTLPVEIYALENDMERCKDRDDITDILYTPILTEYRRIANVINERNDVGMVCIQHEFGLFGGDYGEHILSFMLAVNKPLVTVFHTVLPNPDSKRKNIIEAINNFSEKLIVQTHNSRKILIDEYGISSEKIKVIPHGTHIVLWKDKMALKEKFDFQGKVVLSTFGLISENKNIETVLYALPQIVKEHPNVLFLILGKTHPEVFKKEGEQYREKLISIIDNLNLQSNVTFINKYLELQELMEYLNSSDIYLFSSKDPNQAVSGTFVYAMSTGCPVISTPIPHANELIDGSNGILLQGFHDPAQFQKAILYLIENKEERLSMGNNAFSKMRATSWQNVAIGYGKVFGEITNKEEHLSYQLPPINPKHIQELSTHFGMLQFSHFSTPDPSSGYTLDDNARALIAMVMYYKTNNDKRTLKLITSYLSFIDTVQQDNGWFLNYVGFDQKITIQNQEVNLEDANGRALWCLGYVLSNSQFLPMAITVNAEKCFQKALPNLANFISPRAIGFALKGLYYFHKTSKTNIEKITQQLVDKLMRYYELTSEPDWNWYEDYLTYANSVVPEAMMYAYLILGNKKYKEIAEVTFDFLLSHYFMKGKIQVISNNGWFHKRNQRTFYGEQPIEVAYTIFTLELFFEVTQKSKYKEQLQIAFSWFLGNNHLNQIMYNPVNGSCYDGLERDHININQGAESSICYFIARLHMDRWVTKRTALSQLEENNLFLCGCNDEKQCNQPKHRIIKKHLVI